MTTGRESDEWLMGQVQRGNHACLEKLLRRYASPLLTFIVRMIGDRHRSEELFQEVFLRIWQKRGQYKLNHTFRSWLYTIAANHCRADFRRPVPPVASADLAGVPSTDSSPAHTAMATETRTIVETAIAQLPPPQRTVVVLRVWNGLKYAEIAEITGSNENTVRS
ncbi:MAG: RNA polymerase sigma factor, partial [Planctomycetaceae bacterium]